MGSFRIGRIAGIDIRIHASWFIILGLLTWSISEVFHDINEDWATEVVWLLAAIATILFFTSVLLHELSHSLVAKRLGLPVEHITLFIFGGVSALGGEPTSARQEFLVAIAGPMTSFLIAVVSGLVMLGAWQLSDDQAPVTVVAFYLGLVNVMVGIFNLLPGFPLDGGRVLRATLWARSGNMLKATRWASNAGTFISFGLIALGVLSVLVGNIIGGVWFVVIGWFLRNASESSYQQLLFRRTLEGTKVSQILNQAFQAAPPDISLSEMVRSYMIAQSQRCVPIVVADELLGLVSMGDLRRVAEEEWGTTSVFKAMTPLEKLHTVAPQDDLTTALEMMATHDVHQLPVLDGRTFLGFVTRADVLRLIQIRTELGGSSN
jgi:Zn-dependent protease/CBS domain-containing protein